MGQPQPSVHVSEPRAQKQDAVCWPVAGQRLTFWFSLLPINILHMHIVDLTDLTLTPPLILRHVSESTQLTNRLQERGVPHSSVRQHCKPSASVPCRQHTIPRCIQRHHQALGQPTVMQQVLLSPVTLALVCRTYGRQRPRPRQGRPFDLGKHNKCLSSISPMWICRF